MTRKKKGRISKHQLEPGQEVDSSDDDSPSQQSNNGCPHITKAINGSNLKKAIKNHTFKPGECQSCSSEPQTQNASATANDKNKLCEEEGADEDKTLWLCLQCGYQGCGRNSTSRHALLHHQTPHSDPHDVVVNPDNWTIWCYKCDDEVGVDSNRRLTECVDTLKKHFAKATSKQPNQLTPKEVLPISKVNLELPSPTKKTVAKNTEESTKLSPKKPINGLRPEATNMMRVKGLSNLGNTCFFNAVLQALSQCRCFVGVLREQCNTGRKWHIDLLPEQRIKDKESVDVTLSSCGALTDSLVKFLDEMDQSSQKKNGVISPAQLFKRVCEKASQFRGFQQQDSHELLRYLLDAVRNEEIKRQRLGLLQEIGIEIGKSASKDVDEKTRASLKALSAITSFTVIEKVFGGQLVSTVQCEECHISSQVFETFMDLCLPIFEEKPSRPGLHKRSNSTEKVDDSHDGVAYQKTDNSKPSRHQDKKMKRLQKREVKKQLKSQKHLSSVVSLDPEGKSQNEEINEKDTEECVEETDVQESNRDEQEISGSQGADSVTSVFPDMDVYITEADVEDNDETSSHHSHTSSKSQNESDLSSLSPSETICASGSTTVESDLTTTETIEDSATQSQVLEIGYLCKQVASLDLNQQSENKDNFALDSSTVASGLTSPSSVDIISTDSGIVGSSTDSGIFRPQDKSAVATNARAAQKCNQKMITTSLMPLAPPCKLASQECSLLSSLHQFTMRELLVGNNKFGCENCSRRKAERTGIKPDEKMPMVYTNASKQLLISSPPAVLTLQLKRFQQVGRNVMKVNRYVEFPVLLDLGPFCSRLALALPHVHRGQRQIIYSLVGVVEHSGKLTGGHYTAFVKVQSSTQEEPTKFPFLNQIFTGEKDLQKLIEEVERKHDVDSSWEMYSDLGEEITNLLEEEQKNCDVPSGKWFHVSDSHVTEVSESTVLRCKAYLLFYERIV